MARRTPPIKGGSSTWAGEEKPNLPHGRDAVIRLKAGSRVGMLWKRNPVPKGRTVTDAPLRLTRVGALTGPVTVTVARLAEKFTPGETTWATRPAIVPGTEVTRTSNERVIEFDTSSHLQAAAAGEKWFGWLITTTSTEGVSFHSTQAAEHEPWLRVTFTTAPQQPTVLTPSWGAVSTPYPVVGCDFVDLSGDTTFAGIRVRVYEDQDQTALVWDSGSVAATVPELDLNQSVYGFPGLTQGMDWFWTAQVKDGDGKWSEESDPVLLRYEPLGTVGLTSPGVGGVVYDYMPTVAWTSSVQAIYRVVVEDTSTNKTVWDTGRVTHAGTRAVTVPAGVLVDGRTYRARVRVWDGQDRESTPGAKAYAEAVRDFHVEELPSVMPLQALTVDDNPGRPGPRLTWDGFADSYVIERDGRVIVWDLDPADAATETPGVFEYTDFTAGTKRAHTYTVRAVRGDAMSPGLTGDWEHTGTDGVLLGDRTYDTWVRLSGATPEPLAMSDTAVVHEPTNSRRRVRITSAMRGYTGTIEGVLEDDWDGYDAADGLATLKDIKSNPGRVYRLWAGDMNIGVTVGDITWVETADSTVGNRRYLVRYTVWQQTDFWDAA